MSKAIPKFCNAMVSLLTELNWIGYNLYGFLKYIFIMFTKNDIETSRTYSFLKTK